MSGSIGRRAFAELVGTAVLGVGVIGSGIAASRLSPGDLGLELWLRERSESSYPDAGKIASQVVVPHRENGVV